jgi:hypothetical protein
VRQVGYLPELNEDEQTKKYQIFVRTFINLRIDSGMANAIFYSRIFSLGGFD